MSSIYRTKFTWRDPNGVGHFARHKSATHVVMTRVVGGNKWHVDSFHVNFEAAERRRRGVPAANLEAVVIEVARPKPRAPTV